MLQRYLIIWLSATSLAAFYWPSWFPNVPDPFTATTQHALWALIVITMFCIGLMLPAHEVRQVFSRWPTVFGGTAIQYLSMPLLAFAIGNLLGLQGGYLTGVVLVGCVPGAMASNVLTLNARGNASYSVSLTTAATLVSPLAVPLALGLTLQSWGWSQVGKLIDSGIFLSWAVVLPVVIGHLFARLLPQATVWFKRLAPQLANLAILWIIAAIVGQTRTQIADLSWIILAALLTINLGGYFAGFFGATAMRLDIPMRRALTLEVGMQNAGLGTTLAKALFPDQAEIWVAPALYTFGCMLTGTLLAWFWSRRAEAAKNPAPAKPATGPSEL
ncbi:MAG TPA: hypothetical protein DCY79_18195 [Planctomycetaceae bacterium]|nr:hypothetical protein [Blastopirellula sp.]HAY81739.1 hypothetical protein [Planctomycetaceae bacterium]